MGEVYRARDTRLGREVAIKVLPPEVSADLDRLRRFEKEARAASSLNHPNIVTIHEVERIDSTSFIVMELVEGKTLRDVLAEGAFPVRRLLAVAVQIAEGLARAHSAGVVHRDLKPENVMVTKGGLVKILDFGLAKLAHPDKDGGELTQGPTVSGGTTPGIVMGTVGYMSPEQASGHPVDFRSDQFSLGSLLYEMATGKQPFLRGTAAQSLSAIIQEEPEPIGTVNAKIPPPLRWIVERCLAKEPRERYASTEDLARELAGVRDHFSEVTFSGEAIAISPIPSRRRIVYALALAAALALSAGVFTLGKRAGEKPIPAFQRVTFRRGSTGQARFASDGQTIVYSAAWDGRPMRLYSTRVDNPESRDFDIPSADLLAVSSSGEMAVKLYPNVSSLAGLRSRRLEGTLARVPLVGGAPREILEDVEGADWSSDGKELAIIRKAGDRRRLEFPIGKRIYEAEWIVSPRVSPGGDLVAFFEAFPKTDKGTDLCVVDAAGRKRTLDNYSGPPRALSGFTLAWAPKGGEIWYAGADLYAVTLSGRRRVLWRFPEGTIAALSDISRDGRVLLTLADWRIGTVGLPPGDSKERELSWLGYSNAAEISSDGTQLLFDDNTATTSAVYLRKTDASSNPIRLVEGAESFALSRDSKWALVQRKGRTSELELVPTGPGSPKIVKLQGIEFGDGGTFFPDGKRLLLIGRQPGRPLRGFVQDIQGGPPRPVLPEGVFDQAISPDGRLLAGKNPDGRIFLYPADGGSPQAAPGPVEPGYINDWSSDGRSLFVTEKVSGSLHKVFQRDLSTGRRQLWKEIAPSDPAGILSIRPLIARDGRSYVYGYSRVLSILYVVQGLK